MINYIKGTLAYKGEDFIVLDNNGIGCKIYVSALTLMNISKEETTVYTYMNVSENDISLYGFLTTEELSLFHRLITVSGVGPKSAVGLLSVLTPAQIIFAIVSDDAKTIASGQGIGKKTAQRIILELRDKLARESDVSAEAALTDAVSSGVSAVSEKSEAVEALVVLGFSRTEAVKAVSAVYTSGMSTEDAIKLGLRALS
ncbi:MAG: Holliday junction branch migration protein RuvA [Clostridiales bacterium]|nr:Holliday junction branch migration protein RuvA [Clostridiales bacterium]MCD8215509.1 Holliday junction branch migration protein RuvA [Clostridiales bacterium]